MATATATVKLSAKIPDVARLTSLAEMLAERVAGVKVPELPLSDVATLTAKFRLEMPDPSRWKTAVPSSADGIIATLPDVSGAVGRITGGLQAIETAASVDFAAELQALKLRLEALSGRIDTDAQATIPALFAADAEIAALLRESPFIRATVALGKLLGFEQVDRIPETVLALGAFIQQLIQDRIGRIVSAIAAASAVASQTEKLAARVTVVFDCARRAELDRLLTRAVDAMTAPAGSALAAIGAVRKDDPATVIAAERALAHATIAVDDYLDGIARVLACVEAATIAVDVDGTKARFLALTAELAGVDARMVTDAAVALAALVTSGKGRIGSAGTPTLDQFRVSVTTAIGDVRTAVDGFDLAVAEGAIDRFGDTLAAPLETLEQFKREMDGLVTGAVDGIGEAVAAVDLTPVRREFDATVAGLDRQVQALAGEITAIRSSVESALDTARTSLADARAFVLEPGTGLKHQLDAVLGELHGLLTGLDIKGVVGGIEATTGTVAVELGRIDLTPTIDATVTAIDAVAAVIDTVAPLIVTDDLRAKLAEATEVLRQVDFGEIRDELQKILDEIIDGINVEAMGRIKAEYANVIAKVETLDPEPVLLKVQSEVFDPLVVELEKIRPAEALAPLTDGFDEAAAQLAGFDPTENLRFLADFHGEVRGKFEELDPSQLLEPVDRALRQARETLGDVLRIHTIHAALDDVSRQVTEFINQLDPKPLFAGLDRGVADFRAAIEGFDPASLTGMLAAVLRDAYERTGLAIDRAGLGVVCAAIKADQSSLKARLATISQRVGIIRADFAAIDLAAARSRLETAQQAVRAAATGLDLDDAEAERLATLVAALEVSARLSTIQSRRIRGETGLERLAVGVETIQTVAQPALVEAERLIDALRAFKAPVIGLWDTLIDPLRGLISIPAGAGVKAILLAVFDALDPRQWREPLEGLLEAVRNKVLAFVGDRVIGRLKALLERINGLIASLNIDALKAAIERARDRVRAQIDALDPGPLLASLKASYDGLVAAFAAIDPGGLIEEIDTLYRVDVLDVIKAIGPAELLVPPLKQLFVEISGLLGMLDLDRILLPVIGELERIRDALLTGVDRAGASYAALIAAIPTGPGGGISVEASVEVG